METRHHTHSPYTQAIFQNYSNPDLDEVCADLHVLWASAQSGVYIARAMKAVVVRHGPECLADEEYARIDRLAVEACADTGISTVFVDFRSSPVGCPCALCASQNFPSHEIVAISQRRNALHLSKGLRRFESLFHAFLTIGPTDLYPSTTPCPWGFERVLSTVGEHGGHMVFGNYVGALFELPNEKAVLLQWSGDCTDEGAAHRLLSAFDNSVRNLAATWIIIDHRNRGELSPALIRQIRAEVMSEGIRSVETLISIGDSPWKLGPVMERLMPSDVRFQISDAATLREALSLIHRPRSRRRQGSLAQAN